MGHARYDQTYTQYKKGEFGTLIHSVRRQWKKALKTALQQVLSWHVLQYAFSLFLFGVKCLVVERHSADGEES